MKVYNKYRELESLQPMWKKIWTMKVPPKVRVYAWRACADILPTKKRLQDKGIELDLRCYLYQAEVETVQHLFSECPLMTVALHVAGIISHPTKEEEETWHEALKQFVVMTDE